MKLETERLFLQEMTSDDFDALYAVLADSDIMQHYPYAFDEARVRNWINKNRERYRVFGFGGLGVIKNDFHDRKDLTPNVCAVYTEKEYRCKGIAGRLLCMAVEDLRANGISPVYLLTDHVGFYEHYGCSYVWFKATEKLRCRECTCISNLRQLVCNVSDWRT